MFTVAYSLSHCSWSKSWWKRSFKTLLQRRRWI